ncbi:MAG: hypothetical protein C4326_00305 [Ignavibacteria bacterium]
MLAYHPYWLEAYSITQEAEQFTRLRLISVEQFRTIRAAFTNPLHVLRTVERVTLFLFGCIAIAALFFVLVQVSPTVDGEPAPEHFLATGILCIVGLELLIRYKKLFRAGIEEAALYAGVSAIIYGGAHAVAPAFHSTVLLAASVIAVPLFAITAIRYVDRLCALAAWTSVLTLLYTSLADTHPYSFPFTLGLFSAAVYALQGRTHMAKQLRVWRRCIETIRLAALVTFYGAGNTFVIHFLLEPGALEIASAPIELLPLSSLSTFAVPLAYVLAGLMQRDRALLRVGLVAEVLSLATFRYYNQSLPIEHALIILGLSLMVLSIGAIQVLKTKKTGFTFAPVPLQLPEEVPLHGVVLYDRFTVQKDAVHAFESGKRHVGSGASLGW